MSRSAVAAALAVDAFAVTGCAAGTTTGAPSSAATAATSTGSAAGTGTSASASAGEPMKVAGDAWSHVHNLAYDGPALLLGMHEGLYRQEPGQQPRLLSETPFDVMGLTYDGTRWLASGYPGAGEDLPGDLGLRGTSAPRGGSCTAGQRLSPSSAQVTLAAPGVQAT